ncbi:hypothetical protein [Tychonema sp. BBK16]|uniref:hypothetical protein n=1 Tax=Tychonema sp. BBK16 TaxID=2699888 RepID=UPI001F226927|nr:hypothetical protein [Tychonema sp. BBK16]MCF6374167.1 hypothetical protein [Tychonema sp. BBK16]
MSLPENNQSDSIADVTIARLIVGKRHCRVLISWQIRTGWIVLFGEDIARFVTAFPQRFGRQQ